MEAVRSNPAKTAYDAFYQYLDRRRLHITNADEGLGPAFMTSVMDPVREIQTPTDSVEETAAMDAVFAKEYKAAFDKECKILSSFKTKLAQFPEFLKLQCFQRKIDNTQLAENVDNTLQISYIINIASHDIDKLLHQMFQARCDSQYARLSKDHKFKPTNLEDLLHWLARFCQERCRASMMEMLTKHEKQKKTSAKGKEKATEATAPPTPAPANTSSSSSSQSKRKAAEVDTDAAGGKAAGGEASGDKAASQGGSKCPSKRRAMTAITYKGDTFKVPKKLADLLLSIQQEKAVTFREVDGVIVIDD
ncbi:hypothetical protein HDU78_000315 [Chytriomyces hyalinus]|nr:hypothetical protein HDU78_000315 [Chytriomyces hyalinus]